MREFIRTKFYVRRVVITMLMVFSVSTVLGTQVGVSPASAAACGSEPTSTTGRVSQTVTVPENDTYTIWSRMKAPTTSPVEYKVYVDNECFTIGGTAQTANSLTWVDHENGSTSDKATVTLGAGTHTLVLTAGTEDLELDRVMLLSDNCTPTGTGDNCQNDTTLPTASITSPAASATVSGTQTIAANAADNDDVERVDFYRGTTLLGSDNSSPYSFAWDTTNVTDGAHSLTVRAYDISGNERISSAVNVTVSNVQAPTPVNANIASFAASPATITAGQSSTLSWNVSAGTGCSINQSVGSISLNGSQSVSPTATTTYTLSCNGTNGGSADTATATVTVNQAPAPVDANITSFTASPTTISVGQASTLTWAVASGTGCSINQAVGSVSLTGTRSVTPTTTTTYTLTCNSQNGGDSDTATATVTVNQAPTPVNANITSFTASSSSITTQPGQSSTLNWAVGAGTNCSINQGVGSVAGSGTRTVQPVSTTTYTLTCDGVNGGTADSEQVTVTVVAAPDTDNDGVKDYIEQASPRGGDANGDGTPDSNQENVVSFVNEKTNTYNTLIANGDCGVITGTLSSEGNDDKHAFGALTFALTCDNPGDEAQVEILLDKQYDTAGWKVVKLNGALTTSQDISSQVIFANKTVAGTALTSLSYTLSDGGDLDEDGSPNGTIVDPVAIVTAAAPTTLPASNGIGAPDSGNGGILSAYVVVTGIIAILTGAGVVYRVKKGKNVQFYQHN